MKQIRKAGTAAVCSVMIGIATVMAWGHVRTNARGLEIIGNAEQCRRDPYVCPAGKLTDGMGNTHDVYAGKSDQQIYRDWERNILAAEKCINTHFRGRDMGDNAFSAMTSAAFNMGCASLRTYYSRARGIRVETSIHRYAQARDWPMMCRHLPDFSGATVGGKFRTLPGLEKRRHDEQALCLTPDAPAETGGGVVPGVSDIVPGGQ